MISQYYQSRNLMRRPFEDARPVRGNVLYFRSICIPNWLRRRPSGAVRLRREAFLLTSSHKATLDPWIQRRLNRTHSPYAVQNVGRFKDLSALRNDGPG